MNNNNRFYVRILSPVHIGCDEVYEPMGFVVDESAATLTAFDPLDFFRALSPVNKTKFADICRKGTIVSLLELNKFMQSQRFDGYSVKICHGFIDHYRQNLAMKPTDRNVQQELNRFSISRTAFNTHDNRPYIPGSAIKGALRTAYLNLLAKNEKRTLYNKLKDKDAAQMLEKGLLHYDKLENDPFRLLKVSDFAPVQASTKIVYAVNVKKEKTDKPRRGVPQILEIIEPGSIFTGTVIVEERYTKEAEIKQPLTQAGLFQSASAFYDHEMKREKEELQAAGLTFPKEDDLVGGWLLRVGRHSGAESVTIKGHRNISIKQAGGRWTALDHATTVWLASETRKDYFKNTLQPFGWAALEQMTEGMDAAFEKIRIEEEKVLIPSAVEIPSANIFQELPVVKQTEPVEEVWDEAYVSFNAGGGGIVTATCKDGKKAELRGKDKALAASAETLHKKLFEGKRKIDKVRVTVHKIGNSYVIISIGP